MGIPEKRRAVRAMLDRWHRDEKRLEKLFGFMTEGDFSDSAEMQRNLGTAIFYAGAFLKSALNQRVDKPTEDRT